MTSSQGYPPSTNPEKSDRKKERNRKYLHKLLIGPMPQIQESATLPEPGTSGSSMQSLGPESASQAWYSDDDLAIDLSGGLTDWVSVFPLVGDMIRAAGGILHRRKGMSQDQFENSAMELVTTHDYISREQVAKLTRIDRVSGNSLTPFMNGGPVGEHWDTAPNGFFDHISKAKETIIGVELGFKADDYGLEVSSRLIAKKKANPEVSMTVLIDGFVSVVMQKPSADLEQNTLDMVLEMRKAGIDVRLNDSGNPLSSDFFAANHIKLWIFDGESAFFGGIGIESQFRSTLYDEMDLVEGPFVVVLNMVALLLLANQRSPLVDNKGVQEINRYPRERLVSLFAKKQPTSGKVTMQLKMNVPGYVQDARREYAGLLYDDRLDEVYILVPYFSDEKIARALVRAAERLARRAKGTGADAKRIHVIFPAKQENRIIADISKYYAYRLRNNPVVDSRQLQGQIGDVAFNMLHAKQMLVVLKDPARNWTKYVKYGGSYNPAGKGQHMWELNATSWQGDWEASDEGDNPPSSNPLKDYLDDVMKVAVDRYSVPFPWGEANFKISLLERAKLAFAEAFWFLT